MGQLKKEKDVTVRITTVADGESFVTESAGEYGRDGEVHCVAYTERHDGDVTRSGLQLRRDALLLHRDGAVSSQMLFAEGQTTKAVYKAYGLDSEFLVQTHQYDVLFGEDRITVDLRYTLMESEGAPGSDFRLEIEIVDRPL